MPKLGYLNFWIDKNKHIKTAINEPCYLTSQELGRMLKLTK